MSLSPVPTRLTVPNALSVLRLALVPALLLLAAAGAVVPFAVLYALSLATDAADGFLARRLGQATAAGARLDSRADLATWLALPLCAWWLRPDVLRAEAPWVAVLLACLVVPTVLGMLRFRRLTSYHTWAAKAAGVALGAALLALFAWGAGAPLRLATVLVAISQLEELAITAVLPGWRADVPTLAHALRELR